VSRLFLFLSGPSSTFIWCTQNKTVRVCWRPSILVPIVAQIKSHFLIYYFQFEFGGFFWVEKFSNRSLKTFSIFFFIEQ
jgi:hypothetical protein